MSESQREAGVVVVYTIGHSTLPLPDFVALLERFSIATLADVRTIPRSRHNPQFEGATVAAAVQERGIAYLHLKELGGLRHTVRGSVNTGWRNLSFRGYADYMQTEAFARALAGLVGVAQDSTTALVCAEALPWRCHRFLIADALVVRGLQVEHIMSDGSLRPHTLNPLARVAGSSLTYPGEPSGGSGPAR